ncbi:MAG: SRPBCC domain-containing protein [Spirochaetes bacterium]|nr:SRPBCC domain-containing protein [Spirochaetota bacterium]
MNNNKTIFISASICAPIKKVWTAWVEPEHVVNWNHASDDWITGKAENNLVIGGKFSYRMEAKDGSAGFDFWGIYTNIEKYKSIEYTLGDNRKVTVSFKENGSNVVIEEYFEAENQNSIDLQRNGWQAILNNFKYYVEKL